MKKECLWAWVAFVLFFGGLLLLARFVDRWTYGGVLFCLWLAGGVWMSFDEPGPWWLKAVRLPLASMHAMGLISICWCMLLFGHPWPSHRNDDES